MSESCFEIVLDVMAREIDMLRYQLKVKEEENAKLFKQAKASSDGAESLCEQVEELKAENAKLRAMIGEGREKHE